MAQPHVPTPLQAMCALLPMGRTDDRAATHAEPVKPREAAWLLAGPAAAAFPTAEAHRLSGSRMALCGAWWDE